MPSKSSCCLLEHPPVYKWTLLIGFLNYLGRLSEKLQSIYELSEKVWKCQAQSRVGSSLTASPPVLLAKGVDGQQDKLSWKALTAIDIEHSSPTEILRHEIHNISLLNGLSREAVADLRLTFPCGNRHF